MSALEKAINYFGNQAQMAEALGVVRMTISQWKVRGVPPHRAVDIEKATKGAVTRQELRPDICGNDGQ